MNWTSILPEILIASTAILIVLSDLVYPKRLLTTALALSGVTAAIVLSVAGNYNLSTSLFSGMLVIDGWSQFLRLILLGVTAGVIFASYDYYDRLKGSWAEYHAIILFALTGLMLMPSAGNLVSAFVAIQISAISLFILVGVLKDSRSSEAALKMMLIGGIASAVMLYGMAFIFGTTSSIQLNEISLAIGSSGDVSTGLLLGVLLLAAGLFFEIAAVPFHMWAPDAYEGAPTPITLYLSAASKIAGIAVIARVFVIAFSQPQSFAADWGIAVAVISALTMTLGNILALMQTNIKRLLAYSGIAHTGYMLIGISVLGFSQGLSGQPQLLFYLAAFALAEVAVFTTVIVITRYLNTDEIGDFAGLSRRSPLASFVLSLGLISLIGLPPTAGFMAKLYIFTGAIDQGLLWLIIIAVLNTVISAYYYLRIVKIMWREEPSSNTRLQMPLVPGLVSVLAGAGLLLLGIAPYLLIKLAETSLISLP